MLAFRRQLEFLLTLIDAHRHRATHATAFYGLTPRREMEDLLLLSGQGAGGEFDADGESTRCDSPIVIGARWVGDDLERITSSLDDRGAESAI